MKWRGYCDGYNTDKALAGQSTQISANTGGLIYTRKVSLMIADPNINTLRFETSDQKAYFDEWSDLSVTFLSGGLASTRLWTVTMPQLTLEETTLRYGAMAVGALRKAYLEGHEYNRHYLNAITYYCEALRLQYISSPTNEGLRTAMLSSLLFICFETQRANMPAALKHVMHGFSMLNELASCTEKAPGLVSIAPAPPALVQEILDCYKPLELQSRSFMGSYKKFFFPPMPSRPGQHYLRAGEGASGPTLHQGQAGLAHRASPPLHSPSSQVGTPWQSQSPPVAQQAAQHSLPSPQSQGSPHSQAGQQSPPRRPPGILPFTKHSPYFRPSWSEITNLDDLPKAFQTHEEAQGYWSLLQKQMVQYIPILTMTTSQLGLTKVKDDAELEAKLASVKQNPQIAKFIAESRYWLQRWIEAFDPLFQSNFRGRLDNPQSYLQVVNLRIEYLILYIYTAIPRYSGLITSKGLTPQYREINVLAEILLGARPSCGFAMDSGWTWPLFVTAFGCRVREVRMEAIRILGQYPIRNALRDSRVFRAIALKNQEVDDANTAYGDDEQAQWLRLRRRELVFEDFGTNIIFRSAQLDEMGRWVLIEEAADFILSEDGTLDWHRQPLSESSSILSGVC